ncbi:MAG: AraC family transcriptional regulator [Spirochaetota bacterium]
MPLSRLKRIGTGSHGIAVERDMPLHAMVTSVGYSIVSERSYDWYGLKRGTSEFVLFQYTIRGEGRLRYERTDRSAVPGTALLLTFPHDNRYWLPASSREWEFIYLCLNGSTIVSLWKEMIRRYGALVTLPPDALALSAAVSVYEKAKDGAIASAFDASRLAYAFAMDLLADLSPHASRTDRPKWFVRVDRHLKANFAEPNPVDAIARLSGYSRHHFTRLFEKETGVSPLAYLLKIRISQAAELLKTSALPVREIGIRTGFTDANYFSRAFRRYFGMSPGDYRRSGM